MDDSVGSGNFSLRGYLPLIRKNYSTHIHGLAVYVKGGLPFARDLSLKDCRFLCMFPTGFTSLSDLLLSSPSITFFVFMYGFLFYFI